jgi:uncharacterized phage-associated protein
MMEEMLLRNLAMPQITDSSLIALQTEAGKAMKLGHSPTVVAEYILNLARNCNNPLTPMQMLKLVYISHGWQLGLYGRPLINESIEAWPYGPVVPSVYHRYKKFGSNFISDVPVNAATEFQPSEISTMDQVFSGYGKRSGISLSSLTHEPGTPWSVTVKQSGIGSVISNDLIEDYYRRLAAPRG